MNYKPEPLKMGCFYHIYNRGNNGINIFFDSENYHHFLRLYDQYIAPIAETYAWCLLKNHFHALIYVRNEGEIITQSLEYSTVLQPQVVNASKQFSHFFNAYTQAINKRYNRSGSLFEKPFRRKEIISDKYFQKLIFYIHNNPVHHGFVENPIEYAWSSYEMILTEKSSQGCHDFVLKLFGSKLSFVDYHTREQNLKEISKFIIE